EVRTLTPPAANLPPDSVVQNYQGNPASMRLRPAREALEVETVWCLRRPPPGNRSKTDAQMRKRSQHTKGAQQEPDQIFREPAPLKQSCPKRKPAGQSKHAAVALCERHPA